MPQITEEELKTAIWHSGGVSEIYAERIAKVIKKLLKQKEEENDTDT